MSVVAADEARFDSVGDTKPLSSGQAIKIILDGLIHDL
jgi:hypothetical protein